MLKVYANQLNMNLYHIHQDFLTCFLRELLMISQISFTTHLFMRKIHSLQAIQDSFLIIFAAVETFTDAWRKSRHISIQ